MTRNRTIARTRPATVAKCIETPGLLAVIDVPVVYYPSEPDEPYLEPKAVKLLAEARRRTSAGDTAWLRKHGAKVYVGGTARHKVRSA